MWYTILITLVVDVAGLLLIYAILSDRVRRVTTTTSQIAALRDEVSRLVVELNQTTERNVALVEDRIASLTEACAAADKRIGLLRREIEKHDVGAQIYSRLVEERRSPRGGSRTPVAPVRPGSADAAPITGGSAGSLPGASAAPAGGVAGSSPQDGGSAGALNAAGGSDGSEKQDPRQRVMMLHRSGFPASLIASRVGMPLGEVELIISLEQRKGQG